MCTVLLFKTTHHLAAPGTEEEQSAELLPEPERQSQFSVMWSGFGGAPGGEHRPLHGLSGLSTCADPGGGASLQHGLLHTPPTPSMEKSSPKGLPALATHSKAYSEQKGGKWLFLEPNPSGTQNLGGGGGGTVAMLLVLVPLGDVPAPRIHSWWLSPSLLQSSWPQNVLPGEVGRFRHSA